MATSRIASPEPSSTSQLVAQRQESRGWALLRGDNGEGRSKSRLIPSGEVARRLGIQTQTLAKRRMNGKDPRGCVYLSATRCAYPEAEVEAFVRQLSERHPRFNLPNPPRPKIVPGVME